VVSSGLLLPDAGLLAALLGRFIFFNVVRDSCEMEAPIAASDPDWAIVRPPRLTCGSHASRFHFEKDHLPPSGRSISRADLALGWFNSLGTRLIFKHALVQVTAHATNLGVAECCLRLNRYRLTYELEKRGEGRVARVGLIDRGVARRGGHKYRRRGRTQRRARCHLGPESQDAATVGGQAR
jgi:hypothetical protein